MPITYTNRKGRMYYLCLGKTKTGTPAEALPAGYEIRESVNGIVSLSKSQPMLLSDEDIRVVKTALQAHPKTQRYRLDVRPTMLVIYEHVGPDAIELGARLIADFEHVLTNDHFLRRL